METENVKKQSDPLRGKNGEAGTEIVNGESNGYGAMYGPPDGGVRAYMVVVASFLTNGLLFGVMNSCSVIYTVLQEQLKEDEVEKSHSRAALVGPLAMGTTFLLSPVSGIIAGTLGLRTTAVAGGSIAALGMLLSSFAANHVDALCFTYGIMYGLGASLAYTPSLTILGHYFKKYLGLVNGIVTIGSSVFTVIIPRLMSHMIQAHGLNWMFMVLAALTFGVALCGLLFKPIPLNNEPIEKRTLLKTIIDVHIWRIMRYRLWALSMPIALFGYFVPYVHIGMFVKLNFPESDQTLPIQCVAVTSGIGRLVFGYLADKPVDRIMLQQISFYVIGTMTILIPFVPYYSLLVGITLVMGLCDGAFIALIGPIAFEMCGSRHAAQAIGNMLGLAALPLSVGPWVAGVLYGQFSSYTVPFVLAGISPLVGASIMFAARFYGRSSKVPSTNGHAATLENGSAAASVALTSKEAANGTLEPEL